MPSTKSCQKSAPLSYVDRFLPNYKDGDHTGNKRYDGQLTDEYYSLGQIWRLTVKENFAESAALINEKINIIKLKLQSLTFPEDRSIAKRSFKGVRFWLYAFLKSNKCQIGY